MRLEASVARQTIPLGALFGGVLAVCAAAAAVWLRLGFPQPLCRFREWTGLPCPTCGSTRMVETLLSGDVVGAFLWNPLVFVALTGMAIWALVSTARVALGRRAVRVVTVPWERAGLRLLAVALLAAGWAWLIWRGI